MSALGWKSHDEGDASPNVSVSSNSRSGYLTWLSGEGAAKILNTKVAELTPESFHKIYEDAWIEDHEKEASIN
ncbi:hypothetical protein ACHAWF_002634, partial [Thalassiosira exigua]